MNTALSAWLLLLLLTRRACSSVGNKHNHNSTVHIRSIVSNVPRKQLIFLLFSRLGTILSHSCYHIEELGSSCFSSVTFFESQRQGRKKAHVIIVDLWWVRHIFYAFVVRPIITCENCCANQRIYKFTLSYWMLKCAAIQWNEFQPKYNFEYVVLILMRHSNWIAKYFIWFSQPVSSKFDDANHFHPNQMRSYV